jgi:hypothetical protein
VSTLRITIEPPTGPPVDRDCSDAALTFGRGTDSDVVVADHSMSRHGAL